MSDRATPRIRGSVFNSPKRGWWSSRYGRPTLRPPKCTSAKVSTVSCSVKTCSNPAMTSSVSSPRKPGMCRKPNVSKNSFCWGLRAWVRSGDSVVEVSVMEGSGARDRCGGADRDGSDDADGDPLVVEQPLRAGGRLEVVDLAQQLRALGDQAVG